MFQITQNKVLKDSVQSTQSISVIMKSSIAAKIIGLSSIFSLRKSLWSPMPMGDTIC